VAARRPERSSNGGLRTARRRVGRSVGGSKREAAAHLPLDRADRERTWSVWSCGWADQSDAGLAGNGGARGRPVSTRWAIGPMSTSRATNRRCTWTITPGASSKATSSFHHGDGISAGGDTGGASRAGCAVRHEQPSVLGFRGAGESSSGLEPDVSPPASAFRRRSGGARLTADTRVGGVVARLAAGSRVRRRLFGARAATHAIRAGTSVSKRRWPLRGGHHGRRRFASVCFGLIPAGEGPLADPRRGPPSKPSR
jgi:hypothetical protein